MNYAKKVVQKREQELRAEAEQNEGQLRRELSILQKERQQWLSMEKKYRMVINELTDKLRQRSSG